MKLTDQQALVLDALQRGVSEFSDLPGGRGRVLFVVRELAALGFCSSDGELTPLGESMAPVDGYPGHWHELPPQDVGPRLQQLRAPAPSPAEEESVDQPGEGPLDSLAVALYEADSGEESNGVLELPVADAAVDAPIDEGEDGEAAVDIDQEGGLG